MNWIQVVYSKLKEIWPLFAPATDKKKKSPVFTSLPQKHESMKPNLTQKAMKLGPNDNWGTGRYFWIEFKLFISNWKRFDPAKAKKTELVFYFPSAKAWKYECMKPNLSPKARKFTEELVDISWVEFKLFIFQLKEIWPLFSPAKAKNWDRFLCYKCASFVPVCAGIIHMATTHISETTLDTKKKSYIIFPRPLGNVYEFSWKSDHYLNFQQKWVKKYVADPETNLGVPVELKAADVHPYFEDQDLDDYPHPNLLRMFLIKNRSWPWLCFPIFPAMIFQQSLGHWGKKDRSRSTCIPICGTTCRGPR